MLKWLPLSLSFATLVIGLSNLEAQAAPQLPAAPGVRPQSIKVFLPKNPERQSNLSYVEPVWRQAATSRVAQFAIEQVIAGPSAQEKRLGFVAPISLRGASNCGGDFTLSITSGVAKVKFCRAVKSAGVGDDARIISSVTTTLKQFSSVRSVLILDHSGNCLGDMSGENRCLRQ